MPKLTLLISFVFIIFYNSSSFAKITCDLPEKLADDYNNKNIATQTPISTKGTPRVYYNYPESNMGFVIERIQNTSEIGYNYKSVANWIDSLIGEIFEEDIEYSFFRGSDFDYQIRSYSYSEFKFNVSNKNFYSCQGNIECQKYKTGLSDLAKNINESKFTESGDFTVIVSDLFIDEQEIGGNNSSIQKMFENTFANNKSIGIYGIKSKFNGNMYNIPGVNLYDKAITRPFFIISIGDKGQVLEFNKLLDRDALKNVSDDDKHFTIFTSDLILNPVIPANINNELFKSKNLVNGIAEWEKFTQLKKFTIKRRKNESISIKFDLSEIQLPDTILLNDLNIETSVWKMDERQDSCWKLLKGKYDLATVTQEGEAINVDFFGKKRLKKIKPKEIYIVNFKIYADELGVQEEDFWMSEWNLDDSDINKVTSTGEQNFPVLNLLKLMRKLDDIQTDEFKRTGRPRTLPIEFNIAMELEK